ncbi:hypothetical protein CVT24_011028 [Panaeolus cyanescens]|uniref:F-box domain-containing protein n=1 Tax=Panaeolus cyanescens TaxID=181874 RepID=A0A409VFZ7_9AGAR|nr:hypothetical protein CVT24_011028 [Panaeolus cyanescens]
MPVSLPSDIYVQIFLHLDIPEILIIRTVCKEFQDLSYSRAIWRNRLQKRVIDAHIPTPGLQGQHLDSLTSQDLERLVQRALTLRKNWTAECPAAKRTADLPAVEPMHVISLDFVQHGGRSLLVSHRLSTSARPRVFHAHVWDLNVWPYKCIAERSWVQGEYRGKAVNISPAEGEAIMVVSNGENLEVLGLDSTTEDGFKVLRSVEAPAQPVQALSGSLALLRHTHEPNVLRLLDIVNGQTDLKLQSLTAEPVRDVIITAEFVLLLKGTSLEFYALPTGTSRQGTLEPLQNFQWPWRVDHAKMALQAFTHTTHVGAFPINIMIRFGSYFPWSINLLHRYELRINPAYDSSKQIDQGNAPYDLPPLLQETIASPIRLHATTDMVLGPYGTAVWIDSHTEDFFNHADRGQRLAGRLCPVRVGDGEEIELSDQVATSTASSLYGIQEEDSWLQVAIDEVEGRIAVGSPEKIMITEYI